MLISKEIQFVTSVNVIIGVTGQTSYKQRIWFCAMTQKGVNMLPSLTINTHYIYTYIYMRIYVDIYVVSAV